MQAKIIFIQFILLSFIFSACENKEPNAYVCVSERDPRYFEYTNGDPYIPVGPNICFERFVKDETDVLHVYEQRFAKLKQNGGNYVRIWLSAPFFEVEHDKAGEYDERVASRIDRLLELAMQNGIKIKFCFENFRKLTGYPAPFSTSVPFDRPVYAVDNTLQSMNDYYTTAGGKSLFLNRARFFAQRYAEHPAVFGWELWNEINSVSADRQIIYDWTVEMLPEIKKMFPNHLVMQSLGSFDRESSREMYETYMTIPTNEVAQVHRYLDPGASWEICRESMDTLAYNSVKEITEYIADKPVLLSEVGAVEAHHEGPSTLYESDSLGILLHDLLFAPFFSGAAGPGQSWHWDYYIEKHDLWWHFSRFTKAIEKIHPVNERFEPNYFSCEQVRFYCLAGDKHTLVWCRDKNSNWHSELVEKQIPEIREMTLSMKDITLKDVNAVTLYDPWEDKVISITSPVDSLQLTFKRSIVIRITHN